MPQRAFLRLQRDVGRLDRAHDAVDEAVAGAVGVELPVGE